MATTAGALSQVSVSQNGAVLSSAAATGGTAPYTYQWYRSITSAFTPGGGNIISGATSLSLTDSGLIPNTQYYYKVIATDSGSVAGTSAQLGVVTSVPTQSQNNFLMSPQLGMIDLRFSQDAVAVQVDVSQATPLYAGQAVKMVNSAGGIPKVVGCTADTDQVLGFINFDIKSLAFNAGDRCELSLSGSAMYLYATGAIGRGLQVTLDVTTVGGVTQLVGSSGSNIVGWAYDQAPAAGALIRVYLKSPNFTFA